MPLNKSKSKAAFSQNVAEMRRAGHPMAQALAAAYRIKRGRAKGGRVHFDIGGYANPSAAPVSGPSVGGGAPLGLNSTSAGGGAPLGLSSGLPTAGGGAPLGLMTGLGGASSSPGSSVTPAPDGGSFANVAPGYGGTAQPTQPGGPAPLGLNYGFPGSFGGGRPLGLGYGNPMPWLSSVGAGRRMPWSGMARGGVPHMDVGGAPTPGGAVSPGGGYSPLGLSYGSPGGTAGGPLGLSYGSPGGSAAPMPGGGSMPSMASGPWASASPSAAPAASAMPAGDANPLGLSYGSPSAGGGGPLGLSYGLPSGAGSVLANAGNVSPLGLMQPAAAAGVGTMGTPFQPTDYGSVAPTQMPWASGVPGMQTMPWNGAQPGQPAWMSGPPRKRGGAVGRALGGPPAPWFVRNEARGMLHSGPVASIVPGRTDRHNVRVASGSYVLPSDHVSSLGQGNTQAGFNVIKNMFSSGPFGSRPMRAGRSNLPKPPKAIMAAGGVPNHTDKPVDVVVAGGEYILTPSEVAHVGNGSVDNGHRVLDEWIKRNRKKHVKVLQSLPGPAK